MQEFRKCGTCGSYKTTCKISGNENDRCHINYTHIPDDSDIYIPGSMTTRKPRPKTNRGV